ncbi:MAG: efflux RND transporter permease subunit, partial [Immundisolibacteraceae bacterium]|nr:efflux RND transporter permease subunit [Immundisolibacteraceae bacterium]
MDKLTQFTLQNARFTWLLIIVLIAGGSATYLTQPRQEDPELITRVAQVVTRMPGVAPERIEQLITRPIEERIKTIAEIKQISSISMTGLSLVTAEVRPQYQQMDPIWNRLRNKMDDLSAELPSGSDGPHVNDDYGRLSVVTLALTGADFSMSELDQLARQVRDQLNVLSLVASVDLFGVQQERVWIEFDAAFSAQFGVNPSMIISALNSQNVILPGGHVEANGQNIVIEPSGDFQSIEDIRQVAIDIGGGQLVYLEDLAMVRRAYVEPAESPAFYNGQPAIVLGVSMVKKSNVVELGQQVTAELAQITPQLPLGVSLDVVIFQPDLVQASVSGAVVNLLQTVAVVLAVVMLFLGWQSGLIVGVMVPLTMFATLIGMSVWGIELHRISIAAIIVALGLLVDNGVVIVEQIRNQLDAGDSKLEASLAPVRSLALPLLTSSFTTVAAFLPLMLIDGGSGEFLRSLGQVVMLALLSSWLIAITIVPAFCYWFLPASAAVISTQNDNSPVEKSAPAYAFYRRLLTGLLAHRLLFIALMIGLLLSSISVFSLVKQRSLGASERNQFTVYLDLPAAAAIDLTIEVTQRLSTYLKDPAENPEVTDTLAYVGAGGPRFFLALTPNDPQPNKAFLVVNTQHADQIGTVMTRVERYIIGQLPEANGRADLLFLGPAALGTVELKITGPDINTLRRLSHQVT